MSKKQLWMLGGSALLYYILPLVAWAALVPCGNSSDPTDLINGSVTCNLCDVGQLIDNILTFLIAVTVPIAVLLFAYSGILMFTSAENPKQLEKAKKIFKSVFIGFAIAISAWLVVEVILHTLVNQQFFVDGKWNKIECVSKITTQSGKPGRLINTTIGDVLNNAIGVVQSPQNVYAPVSNFSPEQLCQATDKTYTYATGDFGSNVCLDAKMNPVCPTLYHMDTAKGCVEDINGTVLGQTVGQTPSNSVTQTAAQTYLTNAGVGVYSSGNCSDATNPSCTSFDGMQQSTLDQVVNLKNACGCVVTITAGTEVGHAVSDLSHSTGYKVDLSFNPPLNSFVQSFTNSGVRSDGAQMYTDPYGNVYAQEANHWDVLVKSVGVYQTPSI